MTNPSEAQIEAVHEIIWPECEWPDESFCRQVAQRAAIAAMQQAATPAAPVQATERDIREANRILREKRGELPAPVQDDDAELKPCPFCGSPAEEGSDDKWGSFVFCTNEETCNALQHNFSDEPRAIAAWNARLTPDRVTPLVEALRFYANEWQQKKGDFGADPTEALYRDRGDIARTALRDGGFDA